MAIKVLVVDDSALMRKKICAVLDTAGGFTLKTAKNGLEAIELNQTFLPDVVTLDINMPEMDGLTALAEMMLQRPVAVVMLSSLTAAGALATLEALALGAVDYIAKPDGTISLVLGQIEQELVLKVRAAAKARLRKTEPDVVATSQQPSSRSRRSISHQTGSKKLALSQSAVSRGAKTITSYADEPDGLVLIGVSTGGPGTLEQILTSLPADFGYPVIVAQHMPAAFTGPFANRLNHLCELEVVEVSTLQQVERGKVYIARGGADLVLTSRVGLLFLQPKPEDPQFRWHPSVELLGRSALECCHAEALVAVMLTGMGNDGAEAFSRIYANGGKTIAESELTAVVYGMPKELIERKGATLVLPAHKIASQLLHWAGS
ncbi:chemotaxis-specific protein-glutamate methyltransferase CheB [Aeromonas veronii]|uniref:chemotaxis protein CheB n=1 Tax=Aeromonas TaxID=642 RepID=UPI001326E548|nr:chemotaxis protein CheB [Aeromonas veronii]MXV30943.1 chemotaxis-specific protein-glutamate methyltransferase CheB [Aeromonas veronii]